MASIYLQNQKADKWGRLASMPFGGQRGYIRSQGNAAQHVAERRMSEPSKTGAGSWRRGQPKGTGAGWGAAQTGDPTGRKCILSEQPQQADQCNHKLASGQRCSQATKLLE